MLHCDICNFELLFSHFPFRVSLCFIFRVKQNKKANISGALDPEDEGSTIRRNACD